MRVQPGPSLHALPPNRVTRADVVANLITRAVHRNVWFRNRGKAFGWPPEVGHQTHFAIRNAILRMLDELDVRCGRYGRMR